MTPLDAALAYAARGWHVFPIWPIRDGRCSCGSGARCEHPGKHPIGALVPRGDHDATLDVGRIRFWWSEIPDASVAVALEPSGLTVLDVDIADGKPGKASLQQLESEIALPDTLCAQTGSGGLHAIYTTRGEACRRIGYRLGIDLLGKGYAVLAPSKHHSGGQYRWLNSLEPAPMPNFPASERASKPSTSSSDVERIPDGQRNNTLASMAGRMRHHGFSEAEILAALRVVNAERCDPPCSDDVIAKIAWSVARYNPTEQPVEVAAFRDALQSAKTPAPVANSSSVPPLAWEIALIERPPTIAMSTGIRELDKLTGGGLATGQVSGWLGSPGSGKTGLLLALVLNLNHQRPILLVESELEAHEACARMAGAVLGLPWADVTDGRVPKTAVVEALRSLNVRVLGCDKVRRGVLGLADVATAAVAMRADNGGISPVIVLDYLQDLARGGTDDAKTRVGDMATHLRQLAQEFDTHVAVVASVSRSFYNIAKASGEADDPLIWLGAGKESGDIDYALALLTGVEVGPKIPGQDWRWARLALAKVRRGETGYVGMRFYGATGRWVEDPQALAHMAIEKRGEARMTQQVTDDDEKILLKVRATPDLSKRVLRETAGLKVARADAAISRLLASGAIVVRDVVAPDALGRPQKRQVLAPAVAPAPKPMNGHHGKALLASVFKS